MTRRLLKLVLVTGVAALLVGVLLGMRSPYGAKRLKTAEGVARLQDARAGLISFDEKDGDLQAGFHADSVAWDADAAHGNGLPPCLVEGKDVPVTVGYLDVRFPSEVGVEGLVLWVRCP